MKIKAPLEIRFVLIGSFLIAGVWAIETGVTHFFGDQTLAPLLSIISLAILATKFPPGFVLSAILPFACLSYFLILDSSRYPLIRSLTACIGGLIAAWASWQKACLDRQIREFEAVIMHLPQPWMLCDSSSKIIRVSRSFAALVGKTQEQLIGVPHFSLLTPAETNPDETEAVNIPGQSKRLQLHPFLGSSQSMIFQATYVPVVIQNDHCLLMILAPS